MGTLEGRNQNWSGQARGHCLHSLQRPKGGRDFQVGVGKEGSYYLAWNGEGGQRGQGGCEILFLKRGELWRGRPVWFWWDGVYELTLMHWVLRVTGGCLVMWLISGGWRFRVECGCLWKRRGLWFC